MAGVWTVDIKYFKSPRARNSLAIGVMMSDEDVVCNSNSMIMAFDRAFRQINQQVHNKKGAKND